MQVKLFVLTNCSTDHGEEELNKVLRSHRVLDTVCEFCHENGGYWSVPVKYLDGGPVAEAPLAWRREKKEEEQNICPVRITEDATNEWTVLKEKGVFDAGSAN